MITHKYTHTLLGHIALIQAGNDRNVMMGKCKIHVNQFDKPVTECK